MLPRKVFGGAALVAAAGGGTAWADYAPELNLVGTAAGGVLADFGEIRPLLDDRGKALADQIGSDAHGCGRALTGGLVDSVPTATRYSDIDGLLAVPSLAKTLDKINLVTGPRLGVPALIVQGVEDELVPVSQVDALVARNCGPGVPIAYQRIPGEHLTTLPPFVASSLTFLRDRFAGRPAANTCQPSRSR